MKYERTSEAEADEANMVVRVSDNDGEAASVYITDPRYGVLHAMTLDEARRSVAYQANFKDTPAIVQVVDPGGHWKDDWMYWCDQT